MSPEKLSHELRKESSPDLTRRRWVIGLSFAGLAIGKLVGAYQTGLIKRLPDAPVWPFDSNRVNASNYAYKRAKSPDAFMMIATYAVTAWLASAGGKRRAVDNPALPVALAAKTLVDTVQTVNFAREEWNDNKALCLYCQIGTLISAASLALSIPEAVRAGKNLLGTGRSPADAVRGTANRVRDRARELVGA